MYTFEVRRLAVVLCLPLAAACGGGNGTTSDAPASDAPAARCDPSAPFGTPVQVAELDSAREDLGARLTADELSVVFCRTSADNTWDLYSATRAAIGDPFGTPQVVGSLNTIYNDLWPALAPDGLGMYFGSDRIVPGTFDVWSSTRATTSAAWGTPTMVADLQDGDEHPYVANASSLYFSSGVRTGAGMNDIFHATLSATGGVTMIENVLGGVNTPAIEVVPVVTADDLRIFFAQNDGTNGYDIYTASRSSTSDGFGAATAGARPVEPGHQRGPELGVSRWLPPVLLQRRRRDRHGPVRRHARVTGAAVGPLSQPGCSRRAR